MAEDSLLRELLACETSIWEALVAGDAAADARALAPAFLGVYPDGFAGRDSHAGQLVSGPTVARYALSDARVLPLGPDCALLAYLASYTRPGRSEGEAMYVSSIWRRRGDGWENLFSQDTPATGQPVP